MEAPATPLSGTRVPRPVQFTRLVPLGPRPAAAVSSSLLTPINRTTEVPPRRDNFTPAELPGDSPNMAFKSDDGGALKRLFFKQSGNTRLFGFSIAPEQIADDWVGEIELRYSLYMRDWLVKFVSDVAGKLNGKKPDMFIADPYADLKRMMKMARPIDMSRPGDGGGMSLPSLTAGQGPDLRPPSFSEDSRFHESQSAYNTAMSTLEKVANQVLRFGNSQDVLRVYEYLQKREYGRDEAIVHWLTLPMNLGKVFLTSNMMSATQTAVDQVAEVLALPFGDDSLFAEILASVSYDPFVCLVANHLEFAGWSERVYRTGKDRQILQKAQNDLLRKIQTRGIAQAARLLVQPPDRSAEAARQSLRPSIINPL